MNEAKHETVWVAPMKRWVSTGHVMGSSEAERELIGIEIVVDVLDKHTRRLEERRYGRYVRGRKSAAARLLPACRRAQVVLVMARGELKAAQNRVAGERADRRAKFLQRLIQTDEYRRAHASHDLMQAQIREIETLQSLDDARRLVPNYGHGYSSR